MTADTSLQIRRIIVAALHLPIDPDELAEDEPLFGAEDDFDSIGSLEIIDAIERTFDLRISDEDLTADLLYSVRSLTEYVAKGLASKGVANHEIEIGG